MIKKGISFHGSAGLFHYFLGIAEYIQKNVKNSEDIFYRGVSGGCIPAFLLASDLPVKKIWLDCIIPWIEEFSLINNSGKSDIKHLFSEKSIKILIKLILQNTQHDTLINSNRKLSIQITRIMPSFNLDEIFNQSSVNKWNSIEELIHCIVASCWVPGMFGDMCYNYNNNMHIDGSFPNGFDDISEDWIDIKTNTFSKFPDLFKLPVYIASLVCIDDIKLAKYLFEAGYQDAKMNSVFFKI
jgi:hypothetical protein